MTTPTPAPAPRPSSAPPSPSTPPPADPAEGLPADPPDGAALLTLERRSRQLGSGISADHLVGEWRLDQLWSKREARPQESAAALLRGLQACLAIEPGDADAVPNSLRLQNSVQLGPVQLRFLGPGELRGRRPLLVFHFSLWQLVWGERVLASGQLAEPAPQRQPFFALITSSAAADASNPAWLAARGRGGGLALWRRQLPSKAPH
jgi:hypothetical protein